MNSVSGAEDTYTTSKSIKPHRLATMVMVFVPPPDCSVLSPGRGDPGSFLCTRGEIVLTRTRLGGMTIKPDGRIVAVHAEGIGEEFVYVGADAM